MRKGKSNIRSKSQTRDRALHVLARMRRKGMTLSAASHEERMDPRTVRKYLGAELRRQDKSRPQPTKTDRLRRDMLIPTSQGAETFTIRGSAEASRLGRYMSAVGKYFHTGDTDALEEFAGQSIAGHRLITDPSTLNHLAAAGSLQLDSIYALPESSS
jgi:hypothetical protein